MPYHVAQSSECPSDRPWAVVKDETGEIMGCHGSEESAMEQMDALYANEADVESVRTYSHDGGVEHRTITVPLDSIEWRDSGDPEKRDMVTLRGHAAVFNSLSEDLGGFREIIEPGFFRDVLRGNPDVRLTFNHDPNYILARTRSNTLDLREDGRGLHVFAYVDKNISWVKDLRATMQAKNVDQMSFAFDLKEGYDDWAVAEDGTVVRTLRSDGASELFDVSIVSYPAYVATSVEMRSVLEDAIKRGRVPGAGAVTGNSFFTFGGNTSGTASTGVTVEVRERAEAEVAEDGAEVSPSASPPVGAGEEVVASEEETGDVEPSATARLKLLASTTAQDERERYLRLLKELNK